MADIGSVLGGRYRLMELLGQGGMATIYRAHDSQLNRDVAAKLLRPEYGRDPDFGSRFRHEAQAAASLNHPNIIAVYDYGQDVNGPFIVMELVDGEDVATILRRSGPLGPRQAARLIAEVARALAAAHAKGIVHRDVKPGNILLSNDGRVKVGDFGIARAVAEAQMTLPGTTLGSVHYFSPEQARGEQATAASDIYSLGIVLFEVLAGRRPFEGDSAASIAMARLGGTVPSPSDVRPGIPPALEAITRRALAPEHGQRFPSASAMADALETYLADRSPAATAADTVGGATLPTPIIPAVPPPMAATATARPNPARVPYADDAYAGANDAARPGASREYEDEDVEERSGGLGGPWVWISGLLGLGILAVVAFLIFRLLTSSTPATTISTKVTVPNFVGQAFDAASAQATSLGLVLVRDQTDPSSDQPADTILGQDPPVGTQVDKNSLVKVRVAVPATSVTVPKITDLSEQQAVEAIVAAGLALGTKSEDFDPVVPIGFVISQDPRAGLQIAPGSQVDYTVSKGPEPTPSPAPSPSPTPSPTPAPTPPPTPPPTATPTAPPPTASPSPSVAAVGDYSCLTLSDATTKVENDGFIVGTTTGPTDGKVASQTPTKNTMRPINSSIDLTFEASPADCVTGP